MIPSIERILFATDLSQNSVNAMHHLVGLAKVTGAKVRVLNVCPPMSDDTKLTLMAFVQSDEARNAAINRRVELAKEALSERQETFWSGAPEEYQSVRDQIESIDVLEGFPAEVIMRQAEKHGCDLILLGAHEHGFSQTFLGTVAKRVLRRTNIPTLIVPYREIPLGSE